MITETSELRVCACLCTCVPACVLALGRTYVQVCVTESEITETSGHNQEPAFI